MKRFPILLIAGLMALACVGCDKGNDDNTQGMGGGESALKSMVVFDEKEFSPDNAYATVYIGIEPHTIDPKHMDLDFYAYAFFAQELSSDVFGDIASKRESTDPPSSDFYNWEIYPYQYYDWYHALYEEICSKPLEEMTSISCIQKQVFMVHQEKDIENYMSGMYDLNQTYDEMGYTVAMEFTYSRRVKLPEEFFDEEEGDFSFLYLSWYSSETVQDNIPYRWFNFTGHEDETMNCHYKKKGNKIVLDKKILLDKRNEKIEIANLEQKN